MNTIQDRPFTLEPKKRNVLVVHRETKANSDEPLWFLCRSDAHWDNPKCRRDLEKKHLDQAMDRNACILDYGDLFCAMEGKGDKRGSKSIRPEHCHGNYLNALEDTAVDYYAPYAKNIALLGVGNHETGVLKNKEVDLTQQLATRLKERTGHYVHCGGYQNWVIVRIRRENSTSTLPLKIYATHGYGGGGPVTIDMIQTNRMAAAIDGADVVMFGHTHDSFHARRAKVLLDQRFEEKRHDLHFVKIPSYKDEFLNTGGMGFHHEKGRPIKPLGAWWMKVFFRVQKKDGKERAWLDLEFVEAT